MWNIGMCKSLIRINLRDYGKEELETIHSKGFV